MNRTALLKALSEDHGAVQWTGETFRVRPTKLYRLNLSSLRSRRDIAVANLQVHR